MAQISCAVTAQLISTFDFATWRVQSLLNLKLKFQASVTVQARLCLTWSETQIVGFLTRRLISLSLGMANPNNFRSHFYKGPYHECRSILFIDKDHTLAIFVNRKVGRQSDCTCLLRITYPCNVYPLIPHFYIVKLRYTAVFIFSLFLIQNIDCGYSLELPRRGGSNLYPQSIF